MESKAKTKDQAIKKLYKMLDEKGVSVKAKQQSKASNLNKELKEGYKNVSMGKCSISQLEYRVQAIRKAIKTFFFPFKLLPFLPDYFLC